MPMNILEIAKKVTGEIGLSQPAAVAAGSDAISIQIRELIDTTARDIIDRHDWQVLLTEGTFTTLATDVQVADVYATFTDFVRWMPQTTFNRTQDRQVFGSVDAQQWAAAKGRTTTTPEYHFRIRGNSILLFEPDTAGDTVAFEYISNKHLIDATRTTKSSVLTADTQLPLLDDQLVALGLKWRMKRENGLEYGENFREYERRMANLIGRETPKENLSLVPGVTRDLAVGYVPDGNWNI